MHYKTLFFILSRFLKKPLQWILFSFINMKLSEGALSKKDERSSLQIDKGLKYKKKYLHCSTCIYKTVNYSKLEAHVEKCGPVKPRRHRCPYCNYQSNKYNGMDLHKWCHTNKSTHQCPVCSFSNNSLSLVVRHTNRDHRAILPDSNPSRKVLLLIE